MTSSPPAAPRGPPAEAAACPMAGPRIPQDDGTHAHRHPDGICRPCLADAWHTYIGAKLAAEAADPNTRTGRGLAGVAHGALVAYLRASRAAFSGQPSRNPSGRPRATPADDSGALTCGAYPFLPVVMHDAMGLPPASPGLPRQTHSHRILDGATHFCAGSLTARKATPAPSGPVPLPNDCTRPLPPMRAEDGHFESCPLAKPGA